MSTSTSTSSISTNPLVLSLNENDFTILRNQDVDGSSFVNLTYEWLVNFPLNISARKATKLATVIKELNNQRCLILKQALKYISPITYDNDAINIENSMFLDGYF